MSAIPHLPFERDVHQLELQLAELEQQPKPSSNIKQAIRNLRVEIKRKRREIFKNLDAWQIVKVARHEERPQTADYIELLFDEFVELHGDKGFGDDRAIVTALAKIDGRKLMFVGQKKGRNLKERNECNYGCAHPEGYRKAIAKMKLAEKYGLPIVTFIDTPGAFPGIEAEERGQAYTIALNLREMAQLKVPIVCIVIGEGGSGGALGIGIGDHVAMLEFSYYSVISPEGCAGILWKHVRHADKAAVALKFTSKDLKRLKVVDEVIEEPLGGAHRDHRATADALTASIISALDNLASIEGDDLVDRRYDRFRRMGVFEERATSEIAAAGDASAADEAGEAATDTSPSNGSSSTSDKATEPASASSTT
ncbi:acetyl-CoA carboxylase carboxyltransferase subunit alpha [Stratiformator vulcanicus]|uniref:Acetyl-coenzyme A carboxylase carboxyl transferase subunit alpha n=1 Tax=Stratiformator vulcanicus TaxID=2527980 RepID=A0A517R5I8_9PLAN|nr:acetyl-CoA carboxylase carboxyltransferase subunit alpha [Stratiformator vulcanicus]QDT39142.1 Acetyl-coenzyme A carboxylase carboxyl transferase subunit alpha [Stratiformator vulcanicus]